MIAISIDSANEIYECAQKVVITRHLIDSPSINEFCRNLQKLERELGESSSDDYWRDFLRVVKHFRFRLCAAPYQIDSLENYVREVISILINRLRDCSNVYPNFVTQSQTLIGSINKLSQQVGTPLLDLLIDVSLTNVNNSVAWVIKESRFIPEVEAIVKTDCRLSNIVVLHPSELNRESCFDNLVVIGSPTWFSQSIFSAPRATILHIIQYSWMKDSWRPEPVFVSPYKLPKLISTHVTNCEGNHNEIDVPSETILPNVEYSSSFHTLKEHCHSYDEIEAYLLILEDDWGIFVEADDASTHLIVDLYEDVTQRIKKISLREIVADTLLIVRTGGGGDYITQIANRIMGKDATKARTLQQKWKTELRSYVDRHGLFETSCDLLDLGSQIAEEVNVRNWIFPRNIKTRDFRDFLAIMRLVGLEEHAHEYWAHMEIITEAHRKAGFELRKLLLEKIDSVDTTQLLRQGKLQIKLAQDNESSMTIFRVKHRSKQTFFVPYSKLDEPFRLGNYVL